MPPSALRALAAVLAAAAGASASAAAVRGGGSAVKVTLLASPASASTSVSPAFFGYNPGDHAAVNGPWTDPAFNAAVAALRPGNLRFPSGTAANYWDWRNGCEGLGSMAPCKKQGVSTIDKFAQTLKAANASAVLVLNMLTDTLSSQLDFLAAAEAAGVSVVAVELGNEFYNNDADYVKAFPTGADYGAEASKWMAAVRAAYPAAAISVVGVPSYRDSNKARLTDWNKRACEHSTSAVQVFSLTAHASALSTAPRHAAPRRNPTPLPSSSPSQSSSRA